MAEKLGSWVQWVRSQVEDYFAGKPVRVSRKAKMACLVIGVWGLYFTVLFARMISETPTQGIEVGHPYVWSDWALHIGIAEIFATKPPSEWFAYHPMYADGKFTYPFLVNFISGMLMRAGLSMPLSFILPSIALSFLMIWGMYRLLILLLRSRAKAFLGMSLFFLAAGIGFIWFLDDFFKDPKLLNLFIPLKEYGKFESRGWAAGSFITGLLLPQRAFLLGMPMALWALIGIIESLFRDDWSLRKRRRILICSGVLVGLLPISHVHSLIAMVIFSGPLFLLHWRRWKELVFFLMPAAVLGGALYLIFVSGGIENRSFMSWNPGFMAHGFFDWFWFWFRVWGFTIPLAMVGFATLRGRQLHSLQAFFGGFFLLFGICNFVLFQPMTWDNSKLLLWCYFGFSALAANLIVDAWRFPRVRSVLRPAAVIAVFLLSATGVTELVLLQRIDSHRFQILGPEEIQLADAIRNRTGSRDRFLTAMIHHHPVMMRAARPILMGYEAWVMNYGFNYQQTKADIKSIYQAAPNARELLAKHRISYVFIGPYELNDFKPNLDFFDGNFPVAFRTPRFRVYDTRALLPR